MDERNHQVTAIDILPMRAAVQPPRMAHHRHAALCLPHSWAKEALRTIGREHLGAGGVENLLGREAADDGGERHAAVGYGDVQVGKTRQRTHHGKLVERHGPKSQGQSLKGGTLRARKKSADLGENAVAVILAKFLSRKILGVRADALMCGNLGRIGRVRADHRTIGHLLE